MNYKEILENILKNGQPKQPVRFDKYNDPIPVENGTIGTFCEIFRHDMSEGFPLSTLRKLPFKSVRVELEGFIKGITYKSWYQERNCHFWDEWANPQETRKILNEQQLSNEDIKEVQKNMDDLGPIYGAQWRDFGEHYGVIPTIIKEDLNGVFCGVDQLRDIVEKLKKNPYDRRMVCSAWNPNQIHLMALPPCHYCFTVVVYGDKLNLCWKQRSVDSVLGLPNNIASYGLLLLLLCAESGLKPGELVGILEDCHIYENHLETVKELIKREEKQLPTAEIVRRSEFSIFDWSYEDVKLINYNPHPKMDMGAVTV